MRKRGKKLRDAAAVTATTEVAPLAPPAPLSTAPATPCTGKGQPARGYRLTSDQKQKQATLAALAKEQFDAVHMAATAEWAGMVSRGENGRGERSADAVAARFSRLCCSRRCRAPS